MLMRIRTAEKRCQTHKICAFLRMQLCLIPTNLIGKAVINPALFTVGMEATANLIHILFNFQHTFFSLLA